MIWRQGRFMHKTTDCNMVVSYEQEGRQNRSDTINKDTWDNMWYKGHVKLGISCGKLGQEDAGTATLDLPECHHSVTLQKMTQ